MKTLLLFFFFIFMFTQPIEAASTNKRVFPYEITSIVMNQNEIVIRGWGMGVEKHHYDSTSTHYYLLELSSNGQTKTYYSNPNYCSQTDMMKVLNTRKCSSNEYYQSGEVCYYNYDYVGFQFVIPLNELKVNQLYSTKLKLYSNVLNFNLNADVFYPIEYPILITKNDIEYKIQSNLFDTQLIVADQAVFDRESPSKNSKIRLSNTYCSSTYGYSRFFEKGSTYKYVYDKKRAESTTFYKVKTNKNDVCKSSRNMITEGSDYDSWIASNWVDYSGIALSIQVNSLNHPPMIEIYEHPTISIDSISTFNYRNYIHAYDPEDGNLTQYVRITNPMNLNALGTHQLNLEVVDSQGEKAYEKLFVSVIDTNTPPTILASDKTIYQYESFDYYKNVYAYDNQDGNLTNRIYYEGSVNTSKLGKYRITYYVSDFKNKITSKTITVEVIRNPKEKIRFISNKTDKLFYQENIPINWKENIQYLIEQLNHPRNYIKKRIKL